MTENKNDPLGIGHWPRWKQIAVFFLAMMTLLAILGWVAKIVEPYHPAAGKRVQKMEPSFAAKIAIIDAGRFVPDVENAPETVRIREALKKAGAVCHASESEIGNGAGVVAKKLQEEKLHAVIVDVLEMLPQVVTPNVESDCPKLLAYYATTRHSGMNHTEATGALRDMLNDIGRASGLADERLPR